MTEPSGTEGYSEQAASLVDQYESVSFETVHAPVLPLLPKASSLVLDIGAGTGRDAAGFAALGHQVVAVEPTSEFREWAVKRHASARIEWVDDHLPDLDVIRAKERKFDVVMLTAVWMHLDESQRKRGMTSVAALIQEGGLLGLTLRYGPVPPGRRMFEVGVEETIDLTLPYGFSLALRMDDQPGLAQPNIRWSRLVFRRSG